jgi:hypothetical protein
MTKPLTTGYIDLDTAVEIVVRHKCPGPGIILRAEGEEAFRDLCELVLGKRVHPRGRTEDAKTFKADRDQFVDLQDDYAKLTTLRYAALDDTGFVFPRVEGPPSYKLIEKGGARHPRAQLVFRESEIKAALGEVSTRDEAPSAAASPKKSLEGPPPRRGAPPKYAWGAIREETFRLMDHNGDFTEDDPEWSVQAHLEKGLLEFCRNKFGKEPAPSTLRDRGKIRRWLADWRNQKQTVGN